MLLLASSLPRKCCLFAWPLRARWYARRYGSTTSLRPPLAFQRASAVPSETASTLAGAFAAGAAGAAALAGTLGRHLDERTLSLGFALLVLTVALGVIVSAVA